MLKLESLQADPIIMAELTYRLQNGRPIAKASKASVKNIDVKRVLEGSFTESHSGLPASAVEAVILDFLRPCLIIRNNRFEVPVSDTWNARLEPHRDLIEKRIPSVGRIEFKFHPRFKWGGTGWLIAPNIVVTNRHVAAEFARKEAGSIVFMRNSLGVTLEAFIDFKEEYNNNGTPMEVSVESVRFLADEGQPDIAILKLNPHNFHLEPIPILSTPLTSSTEVAVIGYPAYDPIRNPLKPEDVTRIFNNIFEFKRLSPGLVLNEEVAPNVFSHDATTLGGNSGSAVLDLKTGYAIGLHFSGVFHESNFAVRAQSILDALAVSSIQIPTAPPLQFIPEPVDNEDTLAEASEELKPEDYADREGYLEGFLGDNSLIPLPTVDDVENILKFGPDGTEAVLKYLHFSVIMNQSRRMCFLSAVNINGAESRKTKRPGWQLDPRIDKESQIMKECYGNPPKFSRGHMTRREDPAWGPDIETATRGNADSMHVTNTVPQMQPFNAGIWLGLEDHALQNARGDEMKISVFTGPFLEDDDPIRFGVQIPTKFWKVIAFIHDETGELCATGYTMSQESFLQREEFVFGEYKTYQTSIRSIEENAGINFGHLAALDPYVGQETAPTPLQNFTQIVFKR